MRGQTDERPGRWRGGWQMGEGAGRYEATMMWDDKSERVKRV